MCSIASGSRVDKRGFGRVVASFLACEGLPFADVLSAERIRRVFSEHGNLFGMNTIYSTTIVLWAFLAQVLRDGKESSCQAAVAQISTSRMQDGLAPPSPDTGDYCRARAKLSEPALREVTVETAEELQQQADLQWLWRGRHAKLVDGFTFTMLDTPANQAEYPQQRAQKKGVGFPIVRACVIVSLATACVMDLAVGPYSGKETGENALLRQMLNSLHEGDLLVADRYYCSFMMIALLLGGGVDVCTRVHQNRHVDIRSIKQSLGLDHVRCKSPTMVRKELWTTLLAYNLIRTTSAAAALLHGKQPRQISFTCTCQYVLSTWMLFSAGRFLCTDIRKFCKTLLRHIASREVADRPGRIEPRVLKRRRHRYPLMQKPRAELKAQLEKMQPMRMIEVVA